MARQRKSHLIGDLVKYKYSDDIGIIEYSYKDAFGWGNHNNFSVLWLDEKGKPEYSQAWNSRNSLEVIDTEHRNENIKKIRKYNRKYGDRAPLFMKEQLVKQLGYKSVHNLKTIYENNDKIRNKQIIIEE